MYGKNIQNAAMQRIRALVWIECKGGLHWSGFLSTINDDFLTILIKILLYADQIFRNRRGQKPPHYALRLRYFERFGLKIRPLNSIERSPMLDFSKRCYKKSR